MVVLCLTVTSITFADELSDLRAENARLKSENAQLRQQVGQLEQTNVQIKAEAQQATQQKLAHYLSITEQENGSRKITTFARQLPLTSGKMRHSSYQLTATNDGGPVTLTIVAGMSPGMFRTARTLELEVDGTAMNIPVTNYDSDRVRAGAGTRTGTSVYNETLTCEFTPDQIATIAKANQVIGVLGIAHLALGREDYNLFSVLAESLATAR